VTHANAPTSLSCVCTRKWSPTDERSRFRSTPSRWRVRLRADADLARACDARRKWIATRRTFARIRLKEDSNGARLE
jgi:hypothetical protein